MDRSYYVTDERLDLNPDAGRLHDLPAAYFNRLMREFMSGREFVAVGANGNRVGFIRDWALSVVDVHTIRITRNSDSLVFDAQGRPIGGAYSAPSRDAVVSDVAGPATYNVNIRWVQTFGDIVAPNGEGQTATRKRRNRETNQDESFTHTPVRLDSWEIQLHNGVIDSTIPNAATDGATADAGWVTIGTVTVTAIGEVDFVTVPERQFYAARDWTTNSAGRVQVAIRSLKDAYDALAANIWELKARRSAAIAGWFAQQLSGLTERGFIFPSNVTAHAGPQLFVKTGAGERGVVRVAPDAAVLTTVLVPDADVVSAALQVGRVGAVAGESASNTERARIYGMGRNLGGQNAWVIGDDHGHVFTRSPLDWSEDFIDALYLDANESRWFYVTSGSGGAPARSTSLANEYGVVWLRAAAPPGLSLLRTTGAVGFCQPHQSVGLRLLFRVRLTAADALKIYGSRLGLADQVDPTGEWAGVGIVLDGGKAYWRVVAYDSAGFSHTQMQQGIEITGALDNAMHWLDIRITADTKMEAYLGIGPTAVFIGNVQMPGGTTLLNGSVCIFAACSSAVDPGGGLYIDRIHALGPGLAA